MKITFKKGKKVDGDKLFFIETKDGEAFNHARLLILINQLAKNEWNIYVKEGWINKGKDFLFPLAVNDAIEKGKNGISFLDDENEGILKDFCKSHYLKFEKFRQSKLNDFIKENENSN